jgi:hypothetical protein
LRTVQDGGDGLISRVFGTVHVTQEHIYTKGARIVEDSPG